jgi:hypothetical protein
MPSISGCKKSCLPRRSSSSARNTKRYRKNREKSLTGLIEDKDSSKEKRAVAAPPAPTRMRSLILLQKRRSSRRRSRSTSGDLTKGGRLAVPLRHTITGRRSMKIP